MRTIKIVKDGNAFIAYDEDNFTNLQESSAGYRDTELEAKENFYALLECED